MASGTRAGRFAAWWSVLRGPALAENARALHGILLAGTAVSLTLLVVSLVFYDRGDTSAVAYGATFVLHVPHLVLVRRGRTKTAAVSFSLLFFAMMTFFVFRFGGMHGIGGFVYPLAVLFGGLFWSGRAAIGLAIAGVGATLAMFLGERSGLLVPPSGRLAPLRVWLVLSAAQVMTAVFVHAALSSIRRSAEAALRHERRLANMVRAAQDAIVLVDDRGATLALNPAAETLFERPEAELLGKPLSDLFDERTAALLDGDARDTLGKRDVPAREVPLPGGGSERRLGEVRMIPVPLGDGARGVEITFVDVTEQRRQHEKRRKLEEQLRAAQRLEALGRLAGGVAHDFNNLLTVILGHVGLLQAGSRPVSPESLESIRDAAARAANLTRQLLSLGRGQVLDPVVLDVNGVLGRLRPLLRRVLREDIELSFDLAPDAPKISVDPGQLEQVVVNLVTNAGDAIRTSGRVTIRTAGVLLDADSVPGPGSYLRLAVEDDGIGMDAATRARIFDPFFTTKEPGRGTGIGLATVHGIVSQANGVIDVESEPGEGSRFEILFPASGTGSGAEEVPGAATSEASPERATILVAEDDPLVRRVSKRLLEAHGHEVLLAEGAEQALAILRERRGAVDVLMTDVVMPGASGVTLADSVASEWPSVRLLFVSGHGQELLTDRGVLLDRFEYLPKPYTSADLETKIRAVLARPH